jgi:hypothetical protein
MRVNNILNEQLKISKNDINIKIEKILNKNI